MSKSLNPWIRKSLEDLLSFDTSPFVSDSGAADTAKGTKKTKQSPRNIVQILKYIPAAQAFIVSDSEYKIPVYLTEACVTALEESYGDNLAIIKSSLVKLTDYYFAPALQASRNVPSDILKQNQKDLSFPFSLVCDNMVELGGSDITTIKDPQDINLVNFEAHKSLNYQSLYLKFAYAQFPQKPGCLPTLGTNAKPIRDEKENKLLPLQVLEALADNHKQSSHANKNTSRNNNHTQHTWDENHESQAQQQLDGHFENNTWEGFTNQYYSGKLSNNKDGDDDDDSVFSTGGLIMQLVTQVSDNSEEEEEEDKQEKEREEQDEQDTSEKEATMTQVEGMTQFSHDPHVFPQTQCSSSTSQQPPSEVDQQPEEQEQPQQPVMEEQPQVLPPAPVQPLEELAHVRTWWNSQEENFSHPKDNTTGHKEGVEATQTQSQQAVDQLPVENNQQILPEKQHDPQETQLPPELQNLNQSTLPSVAAPVISDQLPSTAAPAQKPKGRLAKKKSPLTTPENVLSSQFTPQIPVLVSSQNRKMTRSQLKAAGGNSSSVPADSQINLEYTYETVPPPSSMEKSRISGSPPAPSNKKKEKTTPKHQGNTQASYSSFQESEKEEIVIINDNSSAANNQIKIRKLRKRGKIAKGATLPAILEQESQSDEKEESEEEQLAEKNNKRTQSSQDDHYGDNLVGRKVSKAFESKTRTKTQKLLQGTVLEYDRY
jgi:hypothetical protein